MVINVPFRLSRASCRQLAAAQLVIGLMGLLMILVSIFAVLPFGGVELAQPVAATGFALGIIFPFVITFFALSFGWPNDKYINVPRTRKIIKKVLRPVWVACPADRPPRLRLA